MKTQKDTTYGTVISFRLPNTLVRRLGIKARRSNLDGIETANQFARKLTIDGLCRRTGRALVRQRG